jgi:hypothetical protein
MDLDQYTQPELPPEPPPPPHPATDAVPETIIEIAVPQEPPAAADPTKQDQPHYTGRRKGKVAQKPKPTRDKINTLLLDGNTYPEVIAALGVEGKDLNEDNIRSWHKGGYQDFLASEERKEALQSTRETAVDLLNEKAAMPVQDASRTIAAAQLYELLLSFDPRSFAEALAEKPELYLRLVNALSRLCEGEAATTHRRAQQSVLAAKLKADEPVDQKKLLTEGELKDLTRQVKII